MAHGGLALRDWTYNPLLHQWDIPMHVYLKFLPVSSIFSLVLHA